MPIWVRSLGGEDPLEEGMATLSSILAWRIPWTEEPGRLQSTGSQRVRHKWLSGHTRSADLWYSFSEPQWNWNMPVTCVEMVRGAWRSDRQCWCHEKPRGLWCQKNPGSDPDPVTQPPGELRPTCWERPSRACCLSTPAWHVRVGLRPGVLPCQEIGSPCRLCWTYHLVWGSLSLF